MTAYDLLRALRRRFPEAIIGLVWEGPALYAGYTSPPDHRVFTIDGVSLSWNTAADLAF